MAFLKDYKYDFFITYRRGDNPDEAPWVTRFHRHLEVLLNPVGKVSPESRPSVFRDDSQIRGHQPLPEVLKEAASHSAILVVIMSRRYAKLDSAWCETERQLFAQSVKGKPDEDSRVFVVNSERVAHGDWPDQFKTSKGYDFWITDSGISIPMPLDFVSTATYPGVFRRLADDMLDALKRLLPNRRLWVSDDGLVRVERVSDKAWLEKNSDNPDGFPLTQNDHLPDYVEVRRDDESYDLRYFSDHRELRDRNSGWKYFGSGHWQELDG